MPRAVKKTKKWRPPEEKYCIIIIKREMGLCVDLEGKMFIRERQSFRHFASPLSSLDTIFFNRILRALMDIIFQASSQEMQLLSQKREGLPRRQEEPQARPSSRAVPLRKVQLVFVPSLLPRHCASKKEGRVGGETGEQGGPELRLR